MTWIHIRYPPSHTVFRLLPHLLEEYLQMAFGFIFYFLIFFLAGINFTFWQRVNVFISICLGQRMLSQNTAHHSLQQHKSSRD